MKRLTAADFYLDRPRMLGVRGWSLLIPSALAAVGFCAFAVLAFSFTELATLPAAFRRWIVIVGSFALAIGGEMGTLSATIEIFRKRQHAEAWDWLALAISAAATVAAFVLSFAALLGVNATWSSAVKLYGPIVLGVLAAFDAYAGFAEVGMYLSTYDTRMTDWQHAFDAFRKETQAAQALAATLRQESKPASIAPVNIAPAPQVEAQAQPPTLPVAASLSTADAIIAFYGANPLASQTDAARAVGVTRQAVGQTLTRLQAAGVIHRNGHGVEILS